MSNQTYVRLVAVLPAAFAVYGGAVVVWTLQLREIFSPTLGVLIGALILLIAMAAVGTLLATSRWSVPALLLAGASAWGSFFALPRIYPLVNASSEPPSFLALYGWRGAMILVSLATVASAFWVQSLLRAESSQAGA